MKPMNLNLNILPLWPKNPRDAALQTRLLPSEPLETVLPIHMEKYAFGMLDICGSTQFLETEGVEPLITIIQEFRSMIRDLCSQRGVKVMKWLGDGVLLVADEPGPIIALEVELTTAQLLTLPIRAAASYGEAAIFDGADYIGKPVNLASRLCDEAQAGETLVTKEARKRIMPEWIVFGENRKYEIRSIGEISGVKAATNSLAITLPETP